MTSIILTKFDVAERQLIQAITMFFRDEDPVSIHTLSEAAAQVLCDIGKEFGATSILKNSEIIKEEKMKEWIRLISKSKNFFKHADRDKNETHEFKGMFNDFSLLDSVNLYSIIKKSYTPETLVFISWFMLEYPNLLKEGSDFFNKFNEAKNNLPSSKNKYKFHNIITVMRSGQNVPPFVTLENGL